MCSFEKLLYVIYKIFDYCYELPENNYGCVFFFKSSNSEITEADLLETKSMILKRT